MPEEARAPNDGMPEEEFAGLLQSVSAMAPLLKGFFPASGKGKEEYGKPTPFAAEHAGERELCRRREALLLALKPYLSPARCAAVDYLIRLSRVGDAIRALQ